MDGETDRDPSDGAFARRASFFGKRAVRLAQQAGAVLGLGSG
jgi:hypothetical protein